MPRLALARAAAALSLFACSGGDGGGIDGGPGPADAGSNLEQPDGVISVASLPQFSSITLAGSFEDGPSIEIRSEMSREGACRLMTFTPSFCDPACPPTELCVDGGCQALPGRLDRGALEWSHPGGQATVTPDGTLFYSSTGAVSAHGSTAVTVEGETLAVDTIEGPAPEADWSQALAARDGDVALRWSNPITGARVRLSMTDCAGSHGGVGEFEIECQAPDRGELVLPDEFLAALESGDWSHGECGSHRLTRYVFTDSADGSFRLEAVSTADFFYFPR